jgi:hypothetical protein
VPNSSATASSAPSSPPVLVGSLRVAVVCFCVSQSLSPPHFQRRACPWYLAVSFPLSRTLLKLSNVENSRDLSRTLCHSHTLSLTLTLTHTHSLSPTHTLSHVYSLSLSHARQSTLLTFVATRKSRAFVTMKPVSCVCWRRSRPAVRSRSTKQVSFSSSSELARRRDHLSHLVTSRCVSRSLR